MNSHTVFIGAGSNSGDRLDYLQRACSLLEALPDTVVTATSPVYLSEPVGVTDQNMFYNAVIRLRTALKPLELLSHTQAIETALGRAEKRQRWGPRVIDLDILLYDQLHIEIDGLTIPHPEMHNRKFVLLPLVDLSNPRHPVFQQNAQELLKTCPDSSSIVQTSHSLQ